MGKYQDFVYWLTIEQRLKKLRVLLPEAEIYPTGSRYVCNPPVLFTDIDFLVYTENEITMKLYRAGFRITNVKTYYINHQSVDNFSSWRKGKVNLIVNGSRDFTTKHVVATHICKMHNIKLKAHRVLIHEALRGNFFPEYYPDDFDRQILKLLINMNGPHGRAIVEAYRAQHGLKEDRNEGGTNLQEVGKADS